MDTTELETMIKHWWQNNSSTKRPAFLSITITHEDIDIFYHEGELLSTIINRLYDNFPNQKNTVTRIYDTLIDEMRKRNISWQEATIFDFLRIFPSRSSFTKVRQIGQGSLSIMAAVVESNHIDWPEH